MKAKKCKSLFREEAEGVGDSVISGALEATVEGMGGQDKCLSAEQSEPVQQSGR